MIFFTIMKCVGSLSTLVERISRRSFRPYCAVSTFPATELVRIAMPMSHSHTLLGLY